MPKFTAGDDVYVGGVKLDNTTVTATAIATAVAAEATARNTAIAAATTAKAPVAGAATLDGTKKIITIPYSIGIWKASTAAALKAAVTVATDGTTFGALGGSDTVEVSDFNLVITMESALTTATNKFKVAASALKSVYGVANAEFTTAALDAE